MIDLETYERSKFCSSCGTFILKPLYIKKTEKHENEIQPIDIQPEDINVDALYYEYINFKNIGVGEAQIFSTVGDWIRARKNAYTEFREKLSAENIFDINYMKRQYHRWLLFKNNKSWTILQRAGTAALKYPDRLQELLLLLQNESYPVEDRVFRGLEGENKVPGIAQGIITALLHTFQPDKYGVWNSRTTDTLNLLKRHPGRNGHIGIKYSKVNKQLKLLADQLNTDLVYIDGFMWYISKRVRVIR